MSTLAKFRSAARDGLRIAGLLLLALCMSACTRGMGDLEQRVAEVKSRKGPPIEPIPVMKTFETFEYTAQNLRDPFSPSTDDEGMNTSGPRPDMNRPREPLELYPLDSLDMVGTLGMGAKDIAGLIKDPDGVIHRVKPNNYLGQNYGRITGVFEDRIELVELVPNGVGGWIERPASIALESK
jgi:type IV pilus assembly protein PilP